MNTVNNNLGVEPQNYMGLAILATILGCCSFYGIGFVIGIVAIYFASQVKSRFNAGDLAGSEKNSRYARILSFVAIGLMILTLLLSLVIYFMFPELYQEQMEQYQILMEQYEQQQALD